MEEAYYNCCHDKTDYHRTENRLFSLTHISVSRLIKDLDLFWKKHIIYYNCCHDKTDYHITVSRLIKDLDLFWKKRIITVAMTKQIIIEQRTDCFH